MKKQSLIADVLGFHQQNVHIRRNMSMSAGKQDSFPRMAIRTTLIVAMLLFGVTAKASPVVDHAVGWVDGNDGTGDGKDPQHPVIAFTVTHANSVLVVTAYVDVGTPVVTNVRFGDGGGIGTGDVAPDASFANSRLVSYLFINPSTASGLSFRADNTNNGFAAALYEVSGANTSLSSITTVTATNAIGTTTADELIVSFAGRNGASAATVNTGSIFTSADWLLGPNILGGGNLSAAHATAPTIGSQNITWNNATDGRIAYAFEAAPPPKGTLISIF